MASRARRSGNFSFNSSKVIDFSFAANRNLEHSESDGNPCLAENAGTGG